MDNYDRDGRIRDIMGSDLEAGEIIDLADSLSEQLLSAQKLIEQQQKEIEELKISLKVMVELFAKQTKEFESLQEENAQLREALKGIVHVGTHGTDIASKEIYSSAEAKIARQALEVEG
ncbi:hypothetical protein [Bacillus sp. FSL K6-3431]|uniref:hypothetical protein n=1 Tax=Bacillus sp. FSL K6-3431 TaxID=2921500 RepID=UPI0030F4DA3C